jgi:hypothetical protein
MNRIGSRPVQWWDLLLVMSVLQFLLQERLINEVVPFFVKEKDILFVAIFGF